MMQNVFDVLDDIVPEGTVESFVEEFVYHTNIVAGEGDLMGQRVRKQTSQVAQEAANMEANLEAFKKIMDGLNDDEASTWVGAAIQATHEHEVLADVWAEMVAAGDGGLMAEVVRFEQDELLATRMQQDERTATNIEQAVLEQAALVNARAPGKRKREEPPDDPLMIPLEDLYLNIDEICQLNRMLGQPPALRLVVAPNLMFHRSSYALYPGCKIVLGPNYLQPRFGIMQGGKAVAGDTGVSMMILLVLWPEADGAFLRANPTALMSYPFKTLRYDLPNKAWMQLDKSVADDHNLVGVSRQHQTDLTRPATFHLKVVSGEAWTGPIPVRLHDKALSRNIGGNGTKLAFLTLPEMPADRTRHPCLALLSEPFVSILRVNP